MDKLRNYSDCKQPEEITLPDWRYADTVQTEGFCHPLLLMTGNKVTKSFPRLSTKCK